MNSTSSLSCVFHALTDFGSGNKQTNVDTLLHRPLDVNPRPYTQIRTPTVVQWEGGGGEGWIKFIPKRNVPFTYLRACLI